MTKQDYIKYGFDVIDCENALGWKFQVKIPEDLAEELPKKMHELGTGYGILWLKDQLKSRCNNDPGFDFKYFIS